MEPMVIAISACVIVSVVSALLLMSEKREKALLLKNIDQLTQKIMARDYQQFANVRLAAQELEAQIEQIKKPDNPHPNFEENLERI